MAYEFVNTVIVGSISGQGSHGQWDEMLLDMGVGWEQSTQQIK